MLLLYAISERCQHIDLHVKKEKYWFTVKVSCAEKDLTGM